MGWTDCPNLLFSRPPSRNLHPPRATMINLYPVLDV